MYNGQIIGRVASLLVAVAALAGCGAPGGRGAAATFSTADDAGGESAGPRKAVIYRMNGDYSDRVPVLMDANRSHLIGFPAPADVMDETGPVRLCEGWWLDRQGMIELNTAFLVFTRNQYSLLDSVPSTGDLMESVMPDAFVTETAVLPFTVRHVLENREQTDSLINSGMHGIKIKHRMRPAYGPWHVDGTER